jgi:putative nucleotidyltransferase with HDIG domain
MATPIHVLVVEDSEDDTALLLSELENGGYAPSHQRVETAEDMEAALSKQTWDVIIADHSMPNFDAIAALHVLRKSDLDLPFIIVSATIGEDVAVGAMKAGAHDYIMKGKLARLVPAVQRELAEAKIRQARRRGEQELKQSHERLERTLEGTIQSMALLTEIRDPYTAGHQRRVAKLACAIAREMKLSEDRVQGLKLAALVHDIGKVSVPSEILTRPGQISDMEFSFIKTHPQIGHNILKPIEFPWPIAEMVLQHHEELNGSGYPWGHSGARILLEARLIRVADVVEAMSNHRPYRLAPGLEKALEEISRNAGILYDPDAVVACVKLFMETGYKLGD